MKGSWLHFLGFVSEGTNTINRFTEWNMTSKFRKPKNSNPMSYIAIFRKKEAYIDIY